MKKFLSVLMLIALVASGCNVGSDAPPADVSPTATAAKADGSATAALFETWSPASAMMEATVEEEGFALDLERVRVVAPAGVAAPGSVVTVSTPAEPTLPSARDFSGLAGNPLRVTLGDGKQPRQPVTIVFDLAGTALAASVSSQSPLGVISQSEETGVIELLPSTWDAGTQRLTVVADHLSWFWPFQFDVGKLIQPMIETLQTTWGLRYPAPDCYGKELTVGGASYRAGPVKNQVVWPCLTLQNGQITLELHSNSPLPWRARTLPRTDGAIAGLADVTGMAIAEYYNLVFSRYAAIESLVVPGASTSFKFDSADPPNLASVRAEPGLFLMADLLFGVEMALAMFGDDPKLVGKLDRASETLDDVNALTCLTGIIETSTETDFLPGLQRFITSTLTCLQLVVKGPAAIVLSILTTGVGLLVAQFQGLIAQVMGDNEVTFAIERQSVTTGVLAGEWGSQHVYLVINQDGSGTLDLNSGCCVGVQYVLDVDFDATPITATIVSRTFLETEGFYPPDHDEAAKPGERITFTVAHDERGEVITITLPERDGNFVGRVVVCFPMQSFCGGS